MNDGGLPPDYFALPEQSIRGPIPDVLTLRLSLKSERPNGAGPGLAVAAFPPRARVVSRLEEKIYARRADRMTVRHRHGQIVAVVEIVSPGNKASIAELRAFIEKTTDLIERGIHLLVVDLFPPTKRDPQGIHKAIWDELAEENYELPADKPLTLAAYDAGPDWVAYVESVAVGDVLPDMPLFLTAGFLRSGTARGHISDDMGSLPGSAKRAARNTSSPTSRSIVTFRDDAAQDLTANDPPSARTSTRPRPFGPRPDSRGGAAGCAGALCSMRSATWRRTG